MPLFSETVLAPSASAQPHPFPVFRMDEQFTVSSLNTAAADAGLREGMSLYPYISQYEISRHFACVRREPEICINPFHTPQLSAAFSVCGPGEFTVLYAEYAFTPAKTHIQAALFTSWQEYLLYVAAPGRSPAGCASHIQNQPYPELLADTSFQRTGRGRRNAS